VPAPQVADCAGHSVDVLLRIYAACVVGQDAAAKHRMPPPGDVNVLVIGRPERAVFYEAADQAQQRLGLPVNPTVCSPRRWTEAADALI
jgi:hypothetical protein